MCFSACVKVLLCLLLGLLLALIMISYSITLQSLIVFMHPVSFFNPLYIDFSAPLVSKHPAEGKDNILDILAPALRVFYPGLDSRLFEDAKARRVQFKSAHAVADEILNVDLGLWELTVKSVKSKDDIVKRKEVNFFYSHGNAENRGSAHFKYDAFARVIRNIESTGKIVTYDYRGFADSIADHYESDPEECLAEDAMRSFASTGLDPSKTILFGHSLGTVVSLRLALELSEQGTPPAAVILEAPLSDASDVCSHWLGGMFIPSLLDTLKGLCSKAIMISLASSDRLRSGKIKSPIYILHGTDDMTLPYVLGKKTYESCLHGASARNDECNEEAGNQNENEKNTCGKPTSEAFCELHTFPEANHLDIFLPNSNRVSHERKTGVQILRDIINTIFQ